MQEEWKTSPKGWILYNSNISKCFGVVGIPKKISDSQGLGVQLQNAPRRTQNVLFLHWHREHELTQTITLCRI